MFSKTVNWLLVPVCLFFICCNGFQTNEEAATVAKQDTVKKDTLPAKHKPKPVDSLTQDEIWAYYLKNPCYLPLVQDTSFWEKGKHIGFSYSELFNDSLPADSKYRNRYLVGDFSVMDAEGQNKTTYEIYPSLKTLKEFNELPENLLSDMETVNYGTAAYKAMVKKLKSRLGDSSDIYLNFLEKVWRYKMIPIRRQYSIEGEYLYYGGQSVVMCEACADTLMMLGRFAASAKGRGLGIRYKNGKEEKYYYETLPTGYYKYYYAGLNLIVSKNWDSQRTYDKLDYQRDVELGGGNHNITLYQDKYELSNFLLFKPGKDYPDAMVQNGIHEVALTIMARGMLGAPNSIGCVRVSDFGAKFLRWWTPQNTKFFIAYQDKCYNKKINLGDTIFDYLPFKSQKEGDAFRRWMNKERPFEAAILELDETGDYRNGYVLDAYYYLKTDYEEYKHGSPDKEKAEKIIPYKNSPLNRIIQMQRY